MKQIIYIVLLFSILTSSCTEVIKMDLNKGKNNKLVVEGSITNEYKKHEVRLSRTVDYFYNQIAPPELGATVSITDGDTIIRFSDSENIGSYKTVNPCAGKVGHIYTLNIQLRNGDSYSAADTIRPIYNMDSIRYEYIKSDIPFDKKYYYNINIFAQEDPKPGQYYQWEMYVNGVDITDTLRLKTFVSDDFVNGSYIYDWTVYRIPDNKITNDTNQVILQMLSISKLKFNYYNAIMTETDYSGGPFAGPSANVPSNISNGAIGNFSASAVTESRMRILKKEEYKAQLKILRHAASLHVSIIPSKQNKCS